jgi:hypothetical protein
MASIPPGTDRVAEPWARRGGPDVLALEVNLHHIADQLAHIQRAQARPPRITDYLLTMPPRTSDQ